MVLAASGLSPALSAPGLGPQTLGQVLEIVGVRFQGDGVPQVAHAEVEATACTEASTVSWRPPDEAFTAAPDVLDDRPCSGAQVAGSGSLSDGRSRATGWFAAYPFGDAPFGLDPAGIGALSLPAAGAWRGADLRLFSVAWGGHQAVMGMAVQQGAGMDGALATAPAAGVDYRVGLYARDDWQLSPVLAATLGLHLDHDMAGNAQSRPRIGLAWQAGPHTRVTALYGTLPQGPAAEALEARGFELSADQVWATGARLRGSASLQDAACANGAPLLASPQWLGKLLLSTPLPWAGLRLGYEWLYDGERIGFDGSTVGAFAQSNLNLASTQLAKGLEWSMSVLNLFEARDPRLAAAGNGLVALDQGRRNVQMRLAYQF